jgi:hypothetical protein
MEGVYLIISHVPFEVSALQPGAYPGMDRFQAMLRKYAPGVTPSEAALAGGESADLFVTGLRAVGRDVSRSRLVAALNRLTAFTADGILPPVDWAVSHRVNHGPVNCAAFVRVVSGRFVPVHGTPPSAFLCMPVPDPARPPVNPVTPLPAGVPPLGGSPSRPTGATTSSVGEG